MKRGISAWRLSRPVSGSRIASSRWCSSAACSAHTTETTPARRASVAITGTGSFAAARGSTPTVEMRIRDTVSARPASTTRGRKRAATIAAGSTIQGSAGERGPPLIATPPASRRSVMTIAEALTRSGWALVRRRRSTLRKFSAESPNRISVHQPIQGAEMTSAAPTALEPTSRIMRTRSFASTTRLRSSSVGQSQDPSLICSLLRLPTGTA